MKRPPLRMARAFTLAELLLAITLSAMLMAGMVAVLDVTLSSQTFNIQTADISQAGRLIADRISRDLRTASDADVLTQGVRIYPADGSGSPYTQIEFRRDTAGTYAGDLVYATTGATGSQTYVILDNTDDLTCTNVTVTLTKEMVDGSYVTTLATVRLTLSYNGETHTVVASGSPRANVQ